MRETLYHLKSQVALLKELDPDLTHFGASTLRQQLGKMPPNMTEQDMLECLKDSDDPEEVMEMALTNFRESKIDRGHQYQFNPSITEPELVAIENQIGTTLPEEYRTFLLYVGNGGVGPGYGIMSLQKAINELLHFTDCENVEEVYKALSQPFVKPKASDDVFECRYNLTGALPISDCGCASYDLLVLTGEERGTIWGLGDIFYPLSLNKTTERFSAEEFMQKMLSPDNKARVTFLQWYQAWLEDGIIKYSGKRLPKLIESKIITPSETETLNFGHNRLTSIGHEIVEFSQLTILNFEHNQLKELPAEISQLKELRTLVLSNNQFSKIPPVVYQLPKLENLFIENNQLTTLDANFGQLQNLKNLNVSDNQLTTLPPELGSLVQLEAFELVNNRLKALPKEIEHLVRLEYLDLSENKLKKLPQEMGMLKALEYLDVSENRLKKLPVEIGLLTKLEFLSVSDNRLKELPKEIGNLKYLEQLNALENKLTQIPREISALTQLVSLNLDGNKLNTLPMELTQLTKLQHLGVSENPLGALPPQLKAFIDKLQREWEDK
jgi:Leucine-rich repeat (LRR) protein